VTFSDLSRLFKSKVAPVSYSIHILFPSLQSRAAWQALAGSSNWANGIPGSPQALYARVIIASPVLLFRR
jgi:hypothetical protein